MNAEEIIASAATPEQADALRKTRDTINQNLPSGFEETVSGGMINWVIPHSLYPLGYHCNPKQPIGHICLTPAKQGITLHIFGIYVVPEVAEWFFGEYERRVGKKADAGKACVRFKKLDLIPYDLIGELAAKITPEQFLAHYRKFDPRMKGK
ncbi:MAG: DUF1801 domain-containing protein [Fimbriimonadaceae bacterium]|nr:DUF1801 domain-containing protein [Fimbriimonadaceae bacterium]